MQDLSTRLSECDKEPVEFIEMIQPLGTLIAINAAQEIVAAATNAEFGILSADLLGKNLQNVLPGEARRLVGSIDGRSESTIPLLVRSQRLGRWISSVGHKQGELKIIELEFSPPTQVDIPSIKFMQDRRESLKSYLSYIAENLQTVTGYDRVMIYQFAPDWTGEVVAESLRGDAHAFFGHHFPATDIPVPARNLFLQNWVRMIADVDAPPIPVLNKNSEPINLSKSFLRSASDIHLEYLRNMNVKGTLTLSLICDGKLWGLVACHHFTPKYLTAEERSICALLAKLVSSRITALSIADSVAASKRVASFTEQLAKEFTHPQLLECIKDYKHSLLNFVKCDGFSYVSKSTVIADGHTPGLDDIKALATVLSTVGENMVYTDSILKTFPQLTSMADIAAGFLAAKVGEDWAIWTRQEVINSISWAGNPNKPVYTEDAAERLSPRVSFETWRETVKGTSSHWKQAEIDAADRLRKTLWQSLDAGKTSTPSLTDPNAYRRMLQNSIREHAAGLQNQLKDVEIEELN